MFLYISKIQKISDITKVTIKKLNRLKIYDELILKKYGLLLK